MALAVDGLVDGDLHGALLAAEPHAVRVEAVRQRDLPLPVGGLAAAPAVLRTHMQNPSSFTNDIQGDPCGRALDVADCTSEVTFS